MRIRALYRSFAECPQKSAPPGFTANSELHITHSAVYEVWASVRFRGIDYFQILNDLDAPVWLPAVLFEIIEETKPPDWECNRFEGEVELICGPHFVSSDVDAYVRMVELQPRSVEQFWDRVGRLQGIDGP